MQIDKEKALIRKQMLEKMDSVSRDVIVRASSVIERKVLDYVDREGIKSVFIYLSFGNEIITDGIIEGLRRRDITVSVPVIEAREMKSVIFEQGDSLVTGHFGIREPVRRCYADDAELCLVPGIAFDRSLMRLGHGRGYYDRYLLRCPQAIRVCAAFEVQRLERVVTEPHDLRMNYIVTEKACYVL